MEVSTMDGRRMEEYPSDDSGSKMGWFWSKGVSIGKKVLVAGFVVTSAPLVVPPLVVASTIAVLFSVPYGLFLATYVCTEKLMSTLLPSTASPSLLLSNEGVNESGGMKKDARGFGGYPDEREGEQRMIGEGEGLMEEDVPEPAMDEELQVEINPIVIEIAGDEKYSEVTSIAVEVSTVVPEDEELVRETRTLIENIRDEGKLDKGKRGAREDLNGVEQVGKDKPLGESDKNLAEAKGEEIRGKKVTGDIGLSENIGRDSDDGKKVVDEQMRGSLEDKPSPASTRSSSRKDADESSDEALPYSEAKLWEKIDAVRIIIGYKAARNSRFMEELKALYLFTGVEPLVSFKDEADIMEATGKLRFLMSVVGIK